MEPSPCGPREENHSALAARLRDPRLSLLHVEQGVSAPHPPPGLSNNSPSRLLRTPITRQYASDTLLHLHLIKKIHTTLRACTHNFRITIGESNRQSRMTRATEIICVPRRRRLICIISRADGRFLLPQPSRKWEKVVWSGEKLVNRINIFLGFCDNFPSREFELFMCFEMKR